MRLSFRLACLVLVAWASVAGCRASDGGPTSPGGPEHAFERLRDAFRSEDWGAVYDAAAGPKARQWFETDFEKMKQELVEKGAASLYAEAVLGVSEAEYLRMNARDVFVRVSETTGKSAEWLRLPDPETLRGAEIVAATVEGEEARLALELDGARREVKLLRENGAWYVEQLTLPDHY